LAGYCIWSWKVVGGAEPVIQTAAIVTPLAVYREEHASVALADARPMAVISARPTSQPFGIAAVPVTGGKLPMTWRRLKHDIHAERALLAHCRAAAVNCSPAMQALLAIIAKGADSTGRIRLGLINRAVNLAIRPLNNSTPREVRDHWNDPLTTLMAGHGDCKDYAIVKYAALIEAGIAERDLSVVILRDLSASEDHAVVAVRLDGTWVVLDNRWLALVRDVNIRRVIPLFVLDEAGVGRNSLQNLEPAFGREWLSKSATTACIPEAFERRSVSDSSINPTIANTAAAASPVQERLPRADSYSLSLPFCLVAS
jgi:predicted transglutaminase-like cysteine proteinase